MKIHKSIIRGMISEHILFTIFILTVILFLFSGCGSAKVDNSFSPSLKEIRTWGGCDGSEDRQFIKAILVFDRNISVQDRSAEKLRITIGGERIDSSNIHLRVQNSNTLEITVPVDKVTSGVLKISPADKNKDCGILDESGKYAVMPLHVDTIVPSGAELALVRSEKGMAEARVVSTANHRSIIWIRITEDGKAIQPDSTGTERMNDAFAVHEHNFLWATEESTAADIAEAINKYFPERLISVTEEDTVIVRSVSEDIQGNIGIEIYTY